MGRRPGGAGGAGRGGIFRQVHRPRASDSPIGCGLACGPWPPRRAGPADDSEARSDLDRDRDSDAGPPAAAGSGTVTVRGPGGGPVLVGLSGSDSARARAAAGEPELRSPAESLALSAGDSDWRPRRHPASDRPWPVTGRGRTTVVTSHESRSRSLSDWRCRVTARPATVRAHGAGSRCVPGPRHGPRRTGGPGPGVCPGRDTAGGRPPS